MNPSVSTRRPRATRRDEDEESDSQGHLEAEESGAESRSSESGRAEGLDTIKSYLREVRKSTLLNFKQEQSLGKRIMAALDAWLRANAPPSAYVMLIADGDARHLYAQFGFAETAPASISMAYVARGPGSSD